MTGAPLPQGADAVIMHEKTARDGPYVIIPGPIQANEGRLPRGREMRAGELVVAPGTRLNPAHLGVIASVGRSEILVQDRPRVAIVPTGDELVPIAQFPGPGQIRETNSTVLSALVRSLGFVADPAPTVADDRESLVHAIRSALAETDLLIVCGGVSAGDRDFVPEALSLAGVEQVFHKVSMKPGKPLFFGMGPAGANGYRVPVFGLPGNPVSGLVGFLLFVAPALWTLHGREETRWPRVRARLAANFSHRGDRPSYHPSRRVAPASDLFETLPTAGSADLASVSRADGFLRFPSEKTDFHAGEELDFLPIAF